MKTIYQEMTPKQIATMLNKSVNAINKAISKMAKEHQEWKKKEKGKVTIKPEGVAWLCEEYYAEVSTYSVEASDAEFKLVQVQAELEKYKALYESQLSMIDEIKLMYQNQLQLSLENQRQQLLLEHEQEYQHVFGRFYKKKK